MVAEAGITDVNLDAHALEENLEWVCATALTEVITAEAEALVICSAKAVHALQLLETATLATAETTISPEEM